MQAHAFQTAALRILQHRDYLLKRHFRAVVHAAALFRIRQQRGVDKAPCVNNDVRPFQQLRPSQGDQIRRAGACPYKMHHSRHPFTITVRKYPGSSGS